MRERSDWAEARGKPKRMRDYTSSLLRLAVPRYLHENKLTTLAAGMFDKNVLLDQL